ncbi:siderophore-interacting protein [Sphingobacterium deserti]|uniref:Siderophore-interacting protein n=1 Tax=Sphingobacterium deserti TaxID=1229276 RepID=A0A0B8T7P2_9SPHI|nr:siderophore-interacting protein [Sphingobacterium deserti]KGE13770.1 siderophore-interacting protein [Sphingobacterium deserti]
MEKPIIAKHVFNVVAKQHITPHYIRITLRGDGAGDFKHCTPGANNKIFIPPAGENHVQFATFDAEKAEWVMPDERIKPIVRTYTHRGMGTADGEIIIDFVDHGDNGPASTWARAAVKDDQLGVAMKLRETALCPAADWYFLIADATAIPVLSCILESLPSTAKGHCLVEVATTDDIHPDIKHAGFTIQYIFNAHPDKGSELAQHAKKVVLPEEGSRFAYVACEYTSVKELRKHFRDELQWTSQEIYAFSYWKAGVAEDKSASDRREEKEEQG